MYEPRGLGFSNVALRRDSLRDALLSPLAQELVDPLVRHPEESANVALAQACLLQKQTGADRLLRG